jgi:hypothetical protein
VAADRHQQLWLQQLVSSNEDAATKSQATCCTKQGQAHLHRQQCHIELNDNEP